MIELPASKILIVEGVEDDPRMKARADRLRAGIPADEVLTVDDDQLAEIVEPEANRPRHGMRCDNKPVVIFNRFRFDESEEQRQARLERHPILGRAVRDYEAHCWFEWRASGTPAARKRSGLVCQPAWLMHTVSGCHFRCAYCDMAYTVNIMLNVEEFIERLDERLERAPQQSLFQLDNHTDTVCFEPEYDATRQFIEYFAQKPGKALELYVGKSDHVDFMLDYDHRGHTVCCWSLAAPTQAEFFEYRAASCDARLDAMAKCEKAGYPVRARFSPIVPTADWREENRYTIRRLFEVSHPDIVTIETIRFMDYDEIATHFDLEKLDPEFLEVMKKAEGCDGGSYGCEVPDSYRLEVYRFMIDEIQKVSPDTRIAFCREQERVWDRFADVLGAQGQHPDSYHCNCGPRSHPETVGAWA